MADTPPPETAPVDTSMDVLNEIFGSDDEQDNEEEFTGFKADESEEENDNSNVDEAGPADAGPADASDGANQSSTVADETLNEAGADEDDDEEDEELEKLRRDLNDGDEDEEQRDDDDAEDEDGEQPSTSLERADGDEQEAKGSGREDGGEGDDEDKPPAESSDDEEVDRSRRQPDIVYDFDLMMQRKREENYRKRKRKNIDIINDSDDVIAELISQMKQAAEDDFELNKNRQPATCKIRLLPKVETPLRKIDLREAFLDAGVLSVITDWLTPLPDRSLPNIKVRESMLTVLHNFHISDSERLKASGIGKAVMYISKHPKESKENKASAKSLIQKWSRFIFNLETDFHSISKEEREQRDYEHMAKAKRVRSDSQAEEKKDVLRPGQKGFIPRARVPQPSNRDYVNRPKTSQELELSHRGNSKKSISRLEQMQRNYNEKRKANKAQRAVKISIEGRKM